MPARSLPQHQTGNQPPPYCPPLESGFTGIGGGGGGEQDSEVVPGQGGGRWEGGGGVGRRIRGPLRDMTAALYSAAGIALAAP